jgi:hypothetical protein
MLSYLLPYAPAALLVLAVLITVWWVLSYIPHTPAGFRKFRAYMSHVRADKLTVLWGVASLIAEPPPKLE